MTVARDRLIRHLTDWRWVVPVVLVIVTAVLAVAVYCIYYRPDQQTNAAAASSAQRAAEDGTVAVLSYAPETLDNDVATAKTFLTGDFLAYYTNFTQQIMAAAAQEQHVTTTATVVRSGVAELYPDSAVVLVFVNKQTVSKDLKSPQGTRTSVRVGLTKVGGSWRISEFDPL